MQVTRTNMAVMVGILDRGGHMRLDNKVALVTGVASGIGAACAQRFVDDGAVVVGLDLGDPPADGAKLADFHVVDVRDEQVVSGAIEATVAAHGRIDIVVNAAGVAGGAPIHLLEQDEWDRVVDINLKGTYLVTKHVIASSMLEKRSGSIINLASIEGVEGMDIASAYNASKGGVVLLTRQIAVDYGRIGIRSNCLCPGFIETPMTAMLRTPGVEAITQRIADAHLLGRFGRPEEVAAAASFLASDDASFITGHAMLVDGGLTAGHSFGLGAMFGL